MADDERPDEHDPEAIVTRTATPRDAAARMALEKRSPTSSERRM